jgi:flagellar hook assembly protein FlgD
MLTTPNPFNAVTTISYDLPTASNVRLEIYNLMGQKVVTLVGGRIETGHHNIQWDASGFANGIYSCKLTAGEKVIAKSMTLLK